MDTEQVTRPRGHVCRESPSPVPGRRSQVPRRAKLGRLCGKGAASRPGPAHTHPGASGLWRSEEVRQDPADGPWDPPDGAGDLRDLPEHATCPRREPRQALPGGCGRRGSSNPLALLPTVSCPHLPIHPQPQPQPQPPDAALPPSSPGVLERKKNK